MTLKKAMRPRDVANKISECITEGDIDNILDFFHPNYVMSFPPTEPTKSGLETIRQSFQPFIDVNAKLLSKVTGELINGDIAVLQANWSIIDGQGNKLGDGSSTEVLKQRVDGSWQYFIDCPLGLPFQK
ncbi:nuclear transport factor 2 family protein [uncultured Dokdonia sp.]|uniref:YybH family protein n=1 Tax=uncultured Dokdonia sp. TaxID=575653 RepID=UPI00260FD0E6|nr:nuclear transport factor 2 family protein [uncultured Dokdonia sp.]